MDPHGESPMQAWHESVLSALARGDTCELGELFQGAQAMWGNEQASRMWLEIVSAFDANAITG